VAIEKLSSHCHIVEKSILVGILKCLGSNSLSISPPFYSRPLLREATVPVLGQKRSAPSQVLANSFLKPYEEWARTFLSTLKTFQRTHLVTFHTPKPMVAKKTRHMENPEHPAFQSLVVYSLFTLWYNKSASKLSEAEDPMCTARWRWGSLPKVRA